MQRVQIGITGLAVVFLVVLLAAAIVVQVRDHVRTFVLPPRFRRARR